jgi:hypothetical protein
MIELGEKSKEEPNRIEVRIRVLFQGADNEPNKQLLLQNFSHKKK